MIRIKLNSLFVLLLCLASCSEPTHGEKFVKGDRLYYEYTIPVTDSLAYYDLSFYTRVDNFKAGNCPLGLDLRWTSPADSLYYEKVWMRTGNTQGKVELYRSGMRFPLNGDWTLRIKAPDKPEGFCGVGVIWEKYYGTR